MGFLPIKPLCAQACVIDIVSAIDQGCGGNIENSEAFWEKITSVFY